MQHIDMEIRVMLLLNFQFYATTPCSFISALCVTLGADSTVHHTANYLVDLALMEPWSIGEQPSLMAAAAVALALHKLEMPVPFEKIELLCRAQVCCLYFCAICPRAQGSFRDTHI
jgi:hypothetical protein